MAESPSSALPGGVEWLPALGGAHLLRAELGRGDPPALILQSASGAEHRIEPGPEARFSRSTDYLVPTGLHWSTAFLHWPDGTRTVLPPPRGDHGELIPLPTRLRPATSTGATGPAPPAPPEAASPTPTAFAPAPPGAPAPAPQTAPTAPAAARVAPAPAAPPTGAAGRVAQAPAAPPEAAPATAAAARVAPVPAAPAPPPPSSVPPTAGATPAPSASASPAPSLLAARPAATFGLPGAAPTRALVPLHWTAQPAGGALEPPRAASSDVAAAAHGWHVRRAGLQSDLSAVADAVVRARDSERMAGDAVLAVLAGAQADLQAVRAARAADATLLAALAGQLEAERSAHAATRRIGGGADAGWALREQLERAHREAALARAETAALRADLEAERVARVRAEEALRKALVVTEAKASLEEHAAEQARAAATAARRPPADSGRLIAALDAAAVSLRATAPAQEVEPSPVDPPPPLDATAALRALGYPAAAPPARTKVTPSPWRLAAERVVPARVADALTPRPGLLRALVALAREDSVAASALLAGLLPAQGAILDVDVSYDLTVRGFGTFAVTVRNGSARVQRIARRRPRREAAFHLDGEPLVLAELLAGEQRRIRRFGRRGVKVNGRRKRVRALAPLPAAGLTLADAVRAGARLEPGLVYRALPYAVAPEWTCGHVFTVAQEIVEFGPRAWYVTARDGVPLDVVEHVVGAAADATVTMTRAAFDRLLRGEPAVEGELPVVRGDRDAVATLKRWTELAAGAE